MNNANDRKLGKLEDLAPERADADAVKGGDDAKKTNRRLQELMDNVVRDGVITADESKSL